MDEKLKRLQESIDKEISKDPYFTEQDKREVRSGIMKMKNGTLTKRPILMPKLLTSISICAFLVILGGIIGKELGFFTSEPPQEVDPPVMVLPGLPVESDEHAEYEDIDNFVWNSYIIETGRSEAHYETNPFRAVKRLWRGCFVWELYSHHCVICDNFI